MAKVEVEVIGVDPPCPRCKKTHENAQKAAAKLAGDKIQVVVEKLNVSAKETISKYGVLMSPAVAINGIVKIMGKVPDSSVIERLIRETL
ncbi:MAG: thioredoxin family protein [Candidatus Bathyarchaeota archaeon]|nr:thioredoxin family protein [Candidatus Bathyarchaeota archaeon]